MKTMLDTRINDYSIFQWGSLLLNRYIYMKNKFKTQQTKLNLYKKKIHNIHIGRKSVRRFDRVVWQTMGTWRCSWRLP